MTWRDLFKAGVMLAVWCLPISAAVGLPLLYLTLASVAADLRHSFAFFQRLNDLNWQALVLIDIAAAFAIFWPLYLVGLLYERPLPWATISTFCGARAAAGDDWAIKIAAAIDALFFVLTSQRDHCARSYAKWAAPEQPA